MGDKESDGEKVESNSSGLQFSLTSEQRELGRMSGEDFKSGSYIAAIQHVLKLATGRPNDPKVLHNKAVVEYYLSDFKRTDEFKKNLLHVCNQIGVNLDDVDSLDDVEHCVYYYNQAVILYHLRQYNAALIILDKVFQFLEPLEETLAKNVCFLLLELYLCTFQPEKALGMVGFIENLLCDKQSADSVGKVRSVTEREKSESHHSNDSEKKETENKDECRLRLQQYKTRCYLLLRSSKGCKREIKSLLNITGLNPSLVYFKANLEYIRGNWRKSMKVLNTVSMQPRSFAETGDNLAVFFYNNMGCIHFHLGRHNLGCFYFQKALQENDNTIKQLCKTEHGINGRPVYTIGANVRYELLYNMGIELLHAKRPQEAFDCLIEAVQVYHTNPRLWLRLAECCIKVHKPDNEADFHLKERKKDIVRPHIGAGPHRKFVLVPYINKPHQLSQEVHLSAMPLPTLEFSAICLRNALQLLPEDSVPTTVASSSSTSTSKPSEESESNTALEGMALTSVPPGNPMKSSEISALRCSILASSAYVALCIGDIIMALHYAKTLLAQPKISAAHKFLGHMYAGEAMVLLDKITDAVEQLDPANLRDLSFGNHTLEKDDKDKIHGTDDSNSQDSSNVKGWFPNSIPIASMIMQYNLTVAYTVRGELDNASESLRQLNTSAKMVGAEIPIQALMLAMYIQMQLGHADFAKKIIKQHCPQYR